MKIQTLTLNSFSHKTCKDSPNCLFIFGDNQKRIGMGGQAQIRNCNNAIGIATKNQ